jgi:hypothetical protein
MEPMKRAPARRVSGSTRFPITVALDAFEAWQRGPTSHRLTLLRRALLGVVEAAGATGAYLEVDAEPLRPISIGVGAIRRRPAEGAAATRFELTADRGRVHLGRIWLDSSGPEAATATRALGRALHASWSDEERRFSLERLHALDAATRAVASVLSVDRVLQVIADRVRELVRAEYAAIGTIDQEGEIDRFITSGMSRLERERIGSTPRGRGILGILIREPHPIRVADIASDPRRHGLPPHHPVMHSFLGAPLIVGPRRRGTST